VGDSGSRITLARPGELRLATDPVCGMKVDPANARGGSFDHAGTRYFFCGPRCRERFAADPAHWLARGPSPTAMGDPAAAAAKAPPRANVPAATLWICPMDPEVVETKPGACRICGMALEPKLAAAGPERNPELDDMSRRLKLAAALTTPLVAVAMGAMLSGHASAHVLSPRAQGWLELLLATPVVLWCGAPFFERMLLSFRSGRLNMFTLIGLGTGVAWLASLAAVAAPGLFPESFRGHDGEVARYFESAAVIVTLVLLGQVLELEARQRTGGAIRAPRRARAQDGAPARRGRLGSGRSARRSRARRPAAGAAGREGAGRRGRPRRPKQRGRSDDHRRADAGGEGRGLARDRGDAQRHRQLRDARRAHRRRHAPGPDRGAGRRGPAQPRASPAPRRQPSPRGSYRRWWPSPCSPSVRGSRSGPSRARRTRSSRPSPS
jgi:YHS domain-containing protein